MNEKLISLAAKLANCDPREHRTLAGLDGFIDTVVHVVDKRMPKVSVTMDLKGSYRIQIRSESI